MTILAPRVTSQHLVNLFTNTFISGSWTKEENVFVNLISEADDCSGGPNKWQNQKNRKKQEATVEGKDRAAATTEILPQGGNPSLGSLLEADKVYLRTSWPLSPCPGQNLEKPTLSPVLVWKMLEGFHLVTYLTLKLFLEYLWNQVRESSKITLTCKINFAKTCNTVGFLLFRGKTGNVKRKNLTMKWSRTTLNNIIYKVSDFAFEKKKKQSSVILLSF